LTGVNKIIFVSGLETDSNAEILNNPHPVAPPSSGCSLFVVLFLGNERGTD